MAVIVKNRNVGIAPRKVRLVCDLIRKRKVSEAIKILRFCEKREIAVVLTKLINSGLDIASGKYDMDNLIISRIFTDEGTPLKRIQARAQGRAFRIKKRTSHITVELQEA